MPANSDTTFWTDIGYTARRQYRSTQDYRNWLSQMKDIPRYFHEQMDEMRAGLKRGFTPPRVTLEGRDASITALTLHESAPGHAFQMPLALEHKQQPEFRQHTYLSAYGEGWALYCETLGLEMGMYDTPYDRFGMLNYQIWRAARLVVDTGIHSQGWSRERAIAYFRDYTALPEHEINTEIDRYIAWPAQALSYYLGEDAIIKSRAKAEKTLGPKFNVRAFHDTVLELGSVPIPVLQTRIDRFIAEGGKGPYPELE